MEAGSRWTTRDIGTFQILQLEIRRDFPRWLQDRYEEARERVRASTEIQRAIQLLRTNWRGLSRAALIEASGSFGAFFSLLAEVIEQPPTPTPDRYLRSDIPPKGQIPQSSQESSSSGQTSLPFSPLERPQKRMRRQRYSDRSESSDSYHRLGRTTYKHFETASVGRCGQISGPAGCNKIFRRNCGISAWVILMNQSPEEVYLELNAKYLCQYLS
jgi:hypothetical protein